MRFAVLAPSSLVLVGLVACGSAADPVVATTPADANQVTIDPNSTTVSQANGASMINNTASSSKMARQSSDDTEEHADLSETATTGLDDGGGTHDTPRGPSAAFAFTTSAAIDLSNVNDSFQADMHFRGNRSGNANMDGNVRVQVSPKPMPTMHGHDDGNLMLTFTLDLNRTLANGDVVQVITEPNLTITKSGRRQTGAVTRTLSGTVHRVRTSTADANANFDLVITHNGTTVVDTYTANKLANRVKTGSTTVVNNLSHETAMVTFNGLSRGKPGQCLCPTGGSVTVQTTAADMSVSTHTYDFTGACGATTVDVMAQNTTAATAATSASPTATSSSASASSTTQVRGEVSWENCVPTTAN